jgi:LysR family transcriptional regulator, regulator of abg operon
MTLNQLTALLAIAERRSVRSAARHLGVTQPALSRGVRELEKELGAVLFERSGTGVILTAIGQTVLKRAAGIQNDVLRLQDEVNQLKRGETGLIRLGLSTVPHIALLPRVLPSFIERFPDVRIKLSEGLFPTMEGKVHDGTIDFYVGPWPQHDHVPNLSIEPLFENRRLIFGRRDHPLAEAGTLANLVDAHWVTGDLTRLSQDEISPLFASFKLPTPRIMVEGQTSLSMIMVAASSDLLTLLPQQWHEFLRGSLVVQCIPVREVLLAPTICIVRRSSLPLTPVAEYISDLFRRAAIAHASTLPDRPVLAR